MKKVGSFFGINLAVAVFEYVIFTISARILGNDYLWLATLIGGITATIVSYFLNAKYVFPGEDYGKTEIAKFFIYNIVKIFTIKECLVYVFGLITPVYEFAFAISSALHLPFDYDFVESTGVFGFTEVILMIITYFTYDKFVFAKKTNKKGEKKIDMEGVGKSGEEH